MAEKNDTVCENFTGCLSGLPPQNQSLLSHKKRDGVDIRKKFLGNHHNFLPPTTKKRFFLSFIAKRERGFRKTVINLQSLQVNVKIPATTIGTGCGGTFFPLDWPMSL